RQGILMPSNHALTFVDCQGVHDAVRRHPGETTTQLAGRFKFFKRTDVARRLNWLADNGYVVREIRKVDGRNSNVWRVMAP
ncbi:MAG: hypothetical protein ACPGVG_18145, partial [Mycobacterium sp.]